MIIFSGSHLDATEKIQSYNSTASFWSKNCLSVAFGEFHKAGLSSQDTLLTWGLAAKGGVPRAGLAPPSHTAPAGSTKGLSIS